MGEQPIDVGSRGDRFGGEELRAVEQMFVAAERFMDDERAGAAVDDGVMVGPNEAVETLAEPDEGAAHEGGRSEVETALAVFAQEGFV